MLVVILNLMIITIQQYQASLEKCDKIFLKKKHFGKDETDDIDIEIKAN